MASTGSTCLTRPLEAQRKIEVKPSTQIASEPEGPASINAASKPKVFEKVYTVEPDVNNVRIGQDTGQQTFMKFKESAGVDQGLQTPEKVQQSRSKAGAQTSPDQPANRQADNRTADKGEQQHAEATAGDRRDLAMGGVGAAAVAAGKGKDAASAGVGAASDAAGKGRDVASAGVGAAAGKGKHILSSGVGAALDVAGTTKDLAVGGVGAVTGTAQRAGEVAVGAAELTKEAAETTAEGVARTGSVAAQVGGGVYNNTIRPFVQLVWWLTFTLPLELASWATEVTLDTAQWIFTSGTDVLKTVTINATMAINKVAGISYHVILGSLRTVNKNMDGLINNTPRLLHKILQQARDHQRGAMEPSTSRPEDDEEHVEVPQLDMPQETDMARAANQALHRAFDETKDLSDSKGTLLAEARKLAWHAWFLVALQVTAFRTILKVTEGMMTWVARAWLQLVQAAFILSAMAVAAPLAATAAGVAYVCHFLLKQILSIRVYQLMVMSYVGPPVHNVMSAVYNTVMPYLEVEEEIEEPEKLHKEEEHEEEKEKEEGSQAELSVLDEFKLYIASWLDTGVSLTAKLLPPEIKIAESETTSAASSESEYGSEHHREEDKSSSSSSSSGSSGVDTQELEKACDDAEAAFNKSYSLATAAAYTVADTLRVVVLGLSRKFNIPLPKWVPGMTTSKHDGDTAAASIAVLPAVEEFNAAAGKGPISGSAAVGTAVHEK